MKNVQLTLACLLATLVFTAVGTVLAAGASSTAAATTAEPEKGPHRGRMLRDGEFALELAIFETGVPPEFRVWLSHAGQPIDPGQVDLNVTLTRLGDVVDNIGFAVEGDFLRGAMEIYEPHSFMVTVTARHQGKTHRWQYDNFEGRTRIEPAVAQALEIATEVAGPATLHQTIPAYGQLWLPPGAHHQLAARFDGVITDLNVRLGDAVRQGQVLMTIESNESPKPYTIVSPVAGFVSQQLSNPGEQTQGRTLLVITDGSQYVARLAIYPSDYSKVRQGSAVTLRLAGEDMALTSSISFLEPQVRQDQARLVWAKLPNSGAQLLEGGFVAAAIEVATITVPLAVKKTGLQAFRDFTVVYARVGDEYEVRMLTLGRTDDLWVEVLGGLPAGTEYVTRNSYILKADIEKSGASHDH